MISMRTWTETILTSFTDWLRWKPKFIEALPVYGGFDTETEGLFICYDKPFIFQFGWLSPDGVNGFAFAVDMTTVPDHRAIIEDWHRLAELLQLYAGHNVKFDLHMMQNADLPYMGDNVFDTMISIRMAHDNIPTRFGGVPLGLKPYSTRYVDAHAKDHDQEIQHARSQIATALNIKLSERLRKTPPPPASWNIGKSWSRGAVNAFFKDATNEPEDFPDIRTCLAYHEWLTEDVPECMRHRIRGNVHRDDVPYTLVDRKLLLKYALKDIVYMLETLELTMPTALKREQQVGLKIEQQLIRPLFEMERVGFKLNKPYIAQAHVKMKAYLRKRRQDLKDMTGQDITCNQGTAILKYIYEVYGIPLTNTDADSLNVVHKEYKGQELGNLIELIQELRTLEKWYSTYLLRFVQEAKLHDYMHTQINQVGAASGRVSSDFQQFPKGAIYDQDGNELFNPRRCVIGEGGDYRGILYYDYSQIELRVQAFYTILLGHPDLNLCRAYMPYKCITADASHTFDYNKREDLENWQGEWYYEEEPWNHWVPTDVHGATTKAAFDIDESHPLYKKLRSAGKRVNFAKNYGAQLNKIHTMFPDMEHEDVIKIDAGYYKAFPSIKLYQNYCYELGNYQPFATNLFGVRYYNVSGHKLINMLIQGSSAYLLKLKIIQLHRFLKNQGGLSKMQMNIHDEISILPHKLSNPQDFATVKHIMEIFPGCKVPIVADVELTTNTWADKEEISIEELLHRWSGPVGELRGGQGNDRHRSA